LQLVALTEFVEPADAVVVGALSVPRWAHSWAGALEGTSLALSIIRTLVGEFWPEYLGAISFKAEEAKFSGVFRDALVFLAAFHHALCNDCCGPVIVNSGHIVLEICAALSAILNKATLTRTIEWSG
jgi:hypothetical protein